MRLNRALKIAAALLVLVILGVLLVWGFIESRKELALEQERERPVKAPLRVSREEGEAVVKLDRETEARSAIEVKPLKQVSRSVEIRAYGAVLLTQEIVDIYNSYSASKAQVEKVGAVLDASKKEYERLRKLNGDNKNISDKTVQNAESIWHSDEAALKAAMVSLRSLEEGTVHKWGRVVTGWLIDDTFSFKRLVRLDDVLIQVTLPRDSTVKSPPETIEVQSPAGVNTSARLVSPATRTDPRLQGMSFLYSAPASTGLIPGMNVVVFIPEGKPVSGFFVNDSAIVLWQGKSWAYVQKNPANFARHEIEGVRVKDGWFLREGFSDNDMVVIKGAQMLLSEELRSQIQVGEEGGGK